VVSDIKGSTQIEGVREMGAEENIRTKRDEITWAGENCVMRSFICTLCQGG
jgi:hypothetical protein